MPSAIRANWRAFSAASAVPRSSKERLNSLPSCGAWEDRHFSEVLAWCEEFVAIGSRNSSTKGKKS